MYARALDKILDNTGETPTSFACGTRKHVPHAVGNWGARRWVITWTDLGSSEIARGNLGAVGIFWDHMGLFGTI